MGESYDSIGSRVIRHFRHYISGSSHVWLKGDYHDPNMCSSPEKVPQDNQTVPAVQTYVPLPVSSTENPKKASEEHCSATIQNVQSSRDKAELDSKSVIQSDFVKITSTDLTRQLQNNDNHIDNKNIKKIDFRFVSFESDIKDTDIQDGENCQEPKVDETDKLTSVSDEIIDVRPMIAEHRKRHASSDRGFEPGHITSNQENRLPNKKVKLSPQKSDRKRKVVSCRLKGGAARRNLGTVINCRSVYYRSVVKDEEDNS